MVDAVVSYVVERLGDLLIEQVVFLQGVRDEVKWLRHKLEWMLCFLKDAEEKVRDGDNTMRQWISDIRDVAYDAEDIIDNFILKVEEGGVEEGEEGGVEEGGGTPKKMWLEECFGKNFCMCRKQYSIIKEAKVYGIGKEINTLKTRLDEIQRNQKLFNIRNIGDARKGSDRMNERLNQLRKETPYDDNEHVVGFKGDIELLISKLVYRVKHRCMISIVGIGGLGKTTVARKLYNTSILRDKFDCYAWVSVSKDYNIQDLLQRTVKSFKRPTTKEEFELFEKMKEDDLESYLRDYLKGRRYLVVVDDVWDADAWASLRRAFPDNKNGSRVIMTTRNKVVAEHCDEMTYVHELPFLKEGESWELFCQKAFPNCDEVDEKKGTFCPASLESLARDMLSKCRGLPLAIVVLGGLLRRKHPDDWLKVKEHIWSHVRNDSDHVRRIMALSFDDLPPHLKLCFLYLGLFPEDYKIDAERLCRLWVAEGFIKLGEQPFEEACLKELIDRSLIQVAVVNWRKIISCRVHDLVRDFAIEKSKELHFLGIYDGNLHLQLTPSNRRLASYCGFHRFVSLDHSDLRLRTLLFFNLEEDCSKTADLRPLCMKLRLLRVLDFAGLRIRGKRLPDEIGKLIHLRYLRLAGTQVREVSPFIGNLHALQTLELISQLINGEPIELPDEISNAKQLRHLIGHFKWPFRVNNLTNLQTLKGVVVEDQMKFKPTDLINLKELHVHFVGDNLECKLDSIGGLKSLRSLQLEVGRLRSLQSLQPLSHCEHLIQLRLTIGGDWKLPTETNEFPPNLMYIYLDNSGLREDPMPVLEKLRNLTILELRDYGGDRLACTAGGFPQLELLQLTGLTGAMLQVEEGGMPLLKGLSIEEGSRVLIPDRLRSLPVQRPLDNREWPY